MNDRQCARGERIRALRSRVTFSARMEEVRTLNFGITHTLHERLWSTPRVQ
jgi:hypothetical protein